MTLDLKLERGSQPTEARIIIDVLADTARLARPSRSLGAARSAPPESRRGESEAGGRRLGRCAERRGGVIIGRPCLGAFRLW